MKTGSARKKRRGTQRVSVTLPRESYAELGRIAERKRVSIAWVVRDAVEQYLRAEAPLFHQRTQTGRTGRT